MAKTITINLGYVAGETIPFALYDPPQAQANLLGHFSATFNASGVSVVDISAVSAAANSQLLLAIGTNADGTAGVFKGLSAYVTVVDDGLGGGNTLPSVDAGGPYSLVGNTTVTMNPTVSDANGDTLTYTWSAVSGSFQNPNILNAVYVPASDTTYSDTITLTVNDGTGNSLDIATVNVTASGAGTGPTVGYIPATASYTAATFSPVTLPAAEPLIFYITGAATHQFQQDLQYVISGVGGDEFNISRTNERFRFRYSSNTGLDVVFDLVGLVLDQAEHRLEFKNNVGGTELECYVDGVLFTGNAFGAQTPKGDLTFDRIGQSGDGLTTMTQGGVYGITLGTQAAWMMVSETDNAFNGADSIGSNNLTFVGAPGTIANTDTLSITALPTEYTAPPSGLTGFAPLTASFTNAKFTPVTLATTEAIEFYIKGFTTDVVSDPQYIFSGADGSYIRIHRNTGRLFFRDETNSINANWDITGLDGGEHKIRIQNNAGNTASELYQDDVLVTALTSNPRVAITFDTIGEISAGGTSATQGAIYGVTLGTQAAWTMLGSTATTAFAGVDTIGSNNLTFTGAPSPVTITDTVEVGV
jgi:hypothetical protein